MSEILTREQLEQYRLCATDSEIHCRDCILYGVEGDCALLVCDTALHYMDKCGLLERQAAVLEQARIALETIHAEYDSFRHSPRIKRLLQGNTDIMTNLKWTEGLEKAWAAIKAIEEVQE